MKCTKPSGPYIAILGLLLVLSFTNLPTGNNADSTLDIEELTSEDVEESRLEQVENISMLNIKDND